MALLCKTKPITKPMLDPLYILYLLLLQYVSWISEVLQWLRFAKKTFFRPLLSPRKLNKASCTNALRPDCPSRKFPGQQNSSDNSEDSESAEETESTEDPEPGRAGIPACLVECRPKGLRLPVDWGVAATGILPCLLSVQAGRACAPFPSAPLNTAPACAPGTRRTSPIYAQG